MLTLNIDLLTKIVGVVLPLIVALVTKERAASWLKAVVLAFLAAVTGVATTALHNNGTIILKQAVESGLTAWVLGVAAYYGLHKPTGLAPAVASLTGGVGLGAASEPVAAPRERTTTK